MEILHFYSISRETWTPHVFGWPCQHLLISSFIRPFHADVGTVLEDPPGCHPWDWALKSINRHRGMEVIKGCAGLPFSPQHASISLNSFRGPMLTSHCRQPPSCSDNATPAPPYPKIETENWSEARRECAQAQGWILKAKGSKISFGDVCALGIQMKKSKLRRNEQDVPRLVIASIASKYVCATVAPVLIVFESKKHIQLSYH